MPANQALAADGPRPRPRPASVARVRPAAEAHVVSQLDSQNRPPRNTESVDLVRGLPFGGHSS